MKETTKQCLKIGVYGLATVANLVASWFIGGKLGQSIGELIVIKSK